MSHDLEIISELQAIRETLTLLLEQLKRGEQNTKALCSTWMPISHYEQALSNSRETRDYEF